MGERTKYTPGTFCWTDLTTTHQDSAKEFYGALLGWEANRDLADIVASAWRWHAAHPDGYASGADRIARQRLAASASRASARVRQKQWHDVTM